MGITNHETQGKQSCDCDGSRHDGVPMGLLLHPPGAEGSAVPDLYDLRLGRSDRRPPGSADRVASIQPTHRLLSLATRGPAQVRLRHLRQEGPHHALGPITPVDPGRALQGLPDRHPRQRGVPHARGLHQHDLIRPAVPPAPRPPRGLMRGGLSVFRTSFRYYFCFPSIIFWAI